MSKLGPVNFGPDRDVTEWGKAYMEQQPISQEMLAAIDREISKLVDTGYKKALALVKKHKKKLDVVAAELIKKETVESEEFEQLMGGPKEKTE